MVTDRLDRFVSTVNLQAVDHAEIEHALYAALLACADLALDEEVIALQRMILHEAGQFSDVAATFYQSMGINPAKEYKTPGGRPVMIVRNGNVIRELLA